MGKKKRYEALLINQDNDYTVVQTTNIYCDIACPCRNSLRGNTLFLKDVSSCINLVYRESVWFA